MSQLLDKINASVKDAMKNRDQRRVTVLRLITSSIKQQEIANRSDGSRVELADSDILTVLERMVKQRLDAKAQFEGAQRTDLAEQEGYEIEIIRQFMPEMLSDEEIAQLIDAGIVELNARGPSDMGKLVSLLKPKIQGRVDMRLVSEMIKNKLNTLSSS